MGEVHSAEEQRQWTAAILEVEARLVAAMGRTLEGHSQTEVARMTRTIAIATLQAAARRPVIVAAINNAAQVYALEND